MSAHPSERPPARPSHRGRGQALVEFALVAPVLLLLLLGAIDLGRLLYAQIVITNAAKEGALVASQGGSFQANQACSDTNMVMCGVLSEAKGGFVQVDKARVTLAPAACVKNAEYPAAGTPPVVSVTVQAPFHVVTPIISAIVGQNLVLGDTAQAQCLVVPDVTFPALPAPTATFTVSPGTTGTVPFTVNFDGSGSSAPGSSISSYSWSFGSSGVTASKTYSAAGSYSVTLTVRNAAGQATTSAPVTITVNPAGSPTCSPVTVSFTATDNHNGGHPHRMGLSATATPATSGLSWAWTEGTTTLASGASPTVDFSSSGPHTVTVTATKASCTYTATQVVTAP